MVSELFKGDVTGISDIQLEFIGDVLESRGYKNAEVSIDVVGKVGDNYLANVKRITVKKDDETFKMIAKIAPKVELLRLSMSAYMMFHNEHIMYTQVLPKFADMQRNANVPNTERLRIIECYGSLSEEPNELILLEDLAPLDFIMLNRFVPLTDDTVKLVLKNFAIFHSLSHAMKKLHPEAYRDVAEKLLHMWVSLDEAEGSKLYFRQVESDMLQMMNEKYKSKIKGTIGQITTIAVENYKTEAGAQHLVIQHGDSWINNFMFRLEDQKTKECCIIDYQIANENNPVLDLYYLIFTSTDHKTRTKHFHEWIAYYFNELAKALSYHGLEIDSIYPREQLDADLKKYAKFAFCTAAVWASVLCRESPEATTFKEAFESENSLENIVDTFRMVSLDEKTGSRFKNIIEGLIESFQELGYM